MHRIRRFLNEKPWLGWVVAGVILAIGIVLYFRLGASNNPYSRERMSETVTFRSASGHEWTMTRGMMEKVLRQRGTVLDPEEGMRDPETGEVGFPYNKTEWQRTIERINKEKQDIIAQQKQRKTSGSK